jgi:type II secretory pathway component PulC
MIRFLIFLAIGYLLYLLFRQVYRIISAPLNNQSETYHKKKSTSRIDEIKEADFTEVESKLHERK